ncbi:putative undecaprenyl-phosphate N-acetylgalactosaminyl 1-phosphate transferase [Chryseobacterium sp. MOF25P]|uniref:sugar transferase n=1 Tax=unclassified Chryseobacterium TaxID=2593645 RepID=UPI000805FC0B|nr:MULTISPECIES: sugar transferase [unclassified Chryseobacterium]OBW42135.1 putative undecaprenyl-phosphate N-acetylgalactosaminyl 1-phosphate transferase [Chryseobacterium sp. MOF25P]OBW45500.1 putative undecaprenyl-phosphate N-acetylgalactosaminyl 1-phosphate transferase [Chryseobacterium sp. BGARF1]
MKKYPWWKALMDYGLSFVAIIVLLPIFFILVILASLDTGFPGIFKQERVGRFGDVFVIYKFRTYHSKRHTKSNFGQWMRKTKLDELPQLFNILKGDMSLVGPRPDIPGYYDQLKNENRLILSLKPGLTSEAGIKYRNEEEILNQQKNPLQYNDEVLFPEKVKMNLEYYHQLSFKNDMYILLKTFSALR